MLTSDPKAAELRPALSSSRETYRTVPARVVAAAARAGVSFPIVPGTLLALDTSQYEFPGDRTYLRFREGGMQ
jgi:hypothetical protein